MIIVKGHCGLVYRLWRKHSKELGGKNAKKVGQRVERRPKEHVSQREEEA